METPTGERAAIYTDSKVAIDSLKKTLHTFLIEKIRNKIQHLATLNWTIHFRWVKAHIGIEGNEAADKLAKEAAQEDGNINTVFNRIPITSVVSKINRKELEQWQLQWNNAAKGVVCRSFFPNLEQRLKTKIPITPEFTALVTGHGKTRAYLHRFKLADDTMCPCNEGQQISYHMIFECNIFEAQRGSTIKKIVDSGGSWPPAKDELTTKYLQAFSNFVKSIDLQKLN
jgi:tubulin alpha